MIEWDFRNAEYARVMQKEPYSRRKRTRTEWFDPDGNIIYDLSRYKAELKKKHGSLASLEFSKCTAKEIEFTEDSYLQTEIVSFNGLCFLSTEATRPYGGVIGGLGPLWRLHARHRTASEVLAAHKGEYDVSVAPIKGCWAYILFMPYERGVARKSVTWALGGDSDRDLLKAGIIDFWKAYKEQSGLTPYGASTPIIEAKPGFSWDAYWIDRLDWELK